PAQGAPFPIVGEDMPAWERNEEPRAEERRPAGYLDLLTWQSRRVRLQPEVDASVRLVVRHAVAMKGHQFLASFTRRDAETMVAFGRNPKAVAGADPYPPVGFQPDRALWRDSLALVEAAGAQAQSQDVQTDRPKTLTWLADLVTADKLERARTLPLDLLGLAADRAKVLLWRHERLPLPLVYLEDAALRGAMRRALELAETVGWRVLRLSVRELAVRLLAPHADEAGGRQPDPKQVQQVVDRLAAERLYWWRLEVPFRNFLLKLPPAVEAAPDADPPGREAIARWRDAVGTAARLAFEEVAQGLGTSGRTLKAVAAAEWGYHGDGGFHAGFRQKLQGALRNYLAEAESAAEKTAP
ncbi:MAG: type I-E CRISPR-associated protein Cse1/CasA, partial [Chloroflexota bacterium]